MKMNKVDLKVSMEIPAALGKLVEDGKITYHELCALMIAADVETVHITVDTKCSEATDVIEAK